ncbi:MAG TPA: hypothetical protein VKM55_25060 [Candidatus Lokiarchaeia archaeon]|nr:hypothetical protein [Candidatus Lokiarchaeia archaeon]
MSKLRKGVIKQRDRKNPSAQKKVAAKQTHAAADAVLRDNFLYRSSIRSFSLAVLFFIFSIFSAGQFWPFNALRSASGSGIAVGYDLLTGVLSFLFFLFMVFAWGNALEIRGNLIEWKHVIVCIIVTIFIAAWGGAAAIIVFLVGAFGLLSLLWYVNR